MEVTNATVGSNVSLYSKKKSHMYIHSVPIVNVIILAVGKPTFSQALGRSKKLNAVFTL